MTYEVVLTARAERELRDAASWWAEHRSTEEAERWYSGIMQALLTLEKNPQRCPIANENGLLPYQLRQLSYGLGRQYTHRAVFTLRGRQVVVLSIRHVARVDALPDDLS